MIKLFENKKMWLTVIIFISIFAIRIPHLSNSPAEIGDLWRQPDTESIARNFVEKRFNIFFPQFNYDGVPPNYVQLEFQVTTFIIALLYRTIGSYYWLARLVPTLFFMVSAYYLFLIGKKFYSLEQAWTIIAIYGVLPINLFYSRAIMPESALLCFSIGAYYYFIKWIDNDKFSTLIGAAILTSLAISQKIPAIFIGLAMIAMCLTKYGVRFILKWPLWLFAAIALIPNILYFAWAYTIAEAQFVSGIATKHILPNFLTAFMSPEALDFYKTSFPQSFGWITLLIFIIGLFTLTKKELPILFYLLTMILNILFVVSIIRFQYYLVLLGPVIALLAGKTIGGLAKKYTFGYILSVVLVMLIFYNATMITQDSFTVCNIRIEAARILDEYTQPSDLILIGTFDPAFLSLSNRSGWRVAIGLYDWIPENPEDAIAYYISNGARYFIVRNNHIYGELGKYYLYYLNENFERKYLDQGFALYKLYKRIDS